MWDINKTKAFADAVIRILGGNWHLTPKHPHGGMNLTAFQFALQDGDTGRGLDFDLRSATSAKKISVNCFWPRSSDNQSFGPGDDSFKRINVSSTRQVEDIAKDIQRRLLKGYPEAYADAKARADQYDANMNKQQETLVWLSSLIGHEPRKGQQGQTIAYNHGVRAIEVNSDGTTAKIEIYQVPVSVAKQILEVLASNVAK